MSTPELFLVAMLLIFGAPYLLWRLGRTEFWAPLVVVEIVAGVDTWGVITVKSAVSRQIVS